MGKRGKVINPKRFSRNRGVASDDMDDEIDAFHKQRDIIPLDANGDIVDSDDEIPVFDLKGMNDDEDEDDETGDIAKIARTEKYLREKFGGVEDAMLEEDESSGANQARDGEGEGSSSGESQGQDRGEGSASGENQGGDGNAEGSGSNDDEDEPERQGSVGGDIEQGTPENNLNWRIDFSGIPQAFLAIIGATSFAAVEFHNRGAISSTALGRLIAIGVVGFLCCMASMLERDRKSLAAQIFGTIAVAAGSLEFLLLVSDNFSSYYGWMILGLGSLAIFLIFVRAYWCLFVCLFVWAYRR